MTEIRARTYDAIVSAMFMCNGVTVIVSCEILTNNLSKRLLLVIYLHKNVGYDYVRVFTVIAYFYVSIQSS